MNALSQIISYIVSFFLLALPTITFTEGVVGQPRSFFSHQTLTQSDKTISHLIYRGLFKHDIFGTLVPDLADNWSISDDGLVYTIKLKEGQKWSNGDTINSDDLIYTAFKTLPLQDVATDKVDERTVRYTLPNKFSPFLSLLTDGVTKANAEEKEDKIIPVTSGKFRVLTVKRSGPIVKEVILKNNDKKDNIQTLVFRYYGSNDELGMAARLGEIDGFLTQNNLELERFTNYRFPAQSVYYALLFNLRKDAVGDLDFRKALAKVLPLDTMIGTYGIAAQGPISRSPFTDAQLKFDYYDKDYVFDYSTKTVTLTVPDIKSHLELASRIADVWKDALGVTVNVIKVDPSKIDKNVIEPRDFEILFYGQEVGHDPDRYVNWHSTQIDAPGLNITGFKQVRADRALEEGRNEIDVNRRFTHYAEFQKSIIENMPVIFLYHPFNNYYVSKNLGGLGEKYTFGLNDRFLDFSNWKRLETN